MHNIFGSLDLQLFAEGAAAGDGGDGAATSGVSAGVPGLQNENGVSSGVPSRRLAELGVPQKLIDRQAKHSKKHSGAKQTQQQTVQPEPASKPAEATAAPEPAAETKPKAKTTEAVSDWDTFFANPDNKKRYEDTISARVKESKAAKETLDKLTPALATIGKIYGVDTSDLSTLDVDKLNKALSADDPEIDQRAVELGVSKDIARQLIDADRTRAELQRLEDERKAAEKQTQRDMYLRQHWDKLNADAQQLKAKFPNFDLETALKNKSFAMLTSPGVNVPIETAYRASFGDELDRQLVQKTKQGISASIMSGQMRPTETGANAPAASAVKATMDMHDPKNRAQIKRLMLEAERQGKKLYPDGTIR